MSSKSASTLLQIEQMIRKRANVSRLSHDDLTAYYYGDGLEGRARERNYRAFSNFFHDVEAEFGVIFPVLVWDRDWTISQFSEYVEKLKNQPWRSMSEGKKQLKQEMTFHSVIFYFAFLAVAITVSITAYSSPKESLLGMSVVNWMLFLVVVLFFWQRKLRQIWSLKTRLGVCIKQIEAQKTSNGRLPP